MDLEYVVNQEGKQAFQQVSKTIARKLALYLQPPISQLDSKIDKRLVKTFGQLFGVIILFRHSQYGLWLSKLGGYLLSPDKAPAGTKRISNLLRSTKWHYGMLIKFLWRQGDSAVQKIEALGKDVFCLWDESVIEKPESIALEGLCTVRSSVAAHCKRIKPGFFNPLGGRPIFVPGMNWTMLMSVGKNVPPTLAAVRWWTTRGKGKSNKRIEEQHLYAKRWQIEIAFRFTKTEFALESPRLWLWENRLKLLLIATLAYAFLLSLLTSLPEPLRHWLLRFWCHRTGKRHRSARVPLYRFRSALSSLWLSHPPPLLTLSNFLE